MMSWRKENPDWDRDWSKGCATAVGEVGEWTDKLKQHPVDGMKY